MPFQRIQRFLSGRLLKRSGLFDATWYRAKYADMLEYKGDPLRHYILHGAAEVRDPSAVFEASYYLSQYPELDPQKVNPLCHYLIVGEKEGAWPNPYFDPDYVRGKIPGMIRTEASLLAAYIAQGSTNIPPSSRLMYEHDLAGNELVRIAEMSPLSYRLSAGQQIDIDSLTQPGSQEKLASGEGLDLLAIEQGTIYFHVVDHDPHFLLLPRKAGEFEPGHYLLRLDLYQPAESLLRSKVYLDYGEGFGEENFKWPGFRIDSSGRLVGLLALDAGVRRIRFDPVDHSLDGRLVYGVRRLHLERVSAPSFYREIAHSVRGEGKSSSRFTAHLAMRALRTGLGPTTKHLRDRHQNWAEERAAEFKDRLSDCFDTGPGLEPEGAVPPAFIEREAIYTVQRAPRLTPVDDVVILVLYSPDGRISSLQRQMIEDWKGGGYKPVIVINAQRYDESILVDDLPVDGLILRENLGYDFGAWRHAISAIGGLDRVNSVVLSNDSVLPVGGADSIENLRKRIEDAKVDVLFGTRNLEVKPHFQSYMIALKKSAISSGALDQFRELPYYLDKNELIYGTELEIGERLADLGYRCDALFEVKEANESGRNPTIHYWEELIDQGFPFWKIQLVTSGFMEADDPRLVKVIGQKRADELRHHLVAREGSHVRPSPPLELETRPAFGVNDDFNEYGAQNAFNPGKSWLRPIALPLADYTPADRIDQSILGIIHCFYTEVSAEILAELKAANIPMRLLLTTDSEEKKAALSESLKALELNGEVIVTPNRGRDVAPFLIEGGRFSKGEEIIFHLHTKKSKHDDRYAGWGNFLRENLIGSKAIVQSILKLFEYDEIGLIYSEHFNEVEGLRNWGYDFEKAESLLARLGCHIDADTPLEFPTSTMFWARRDVLQPLFDLNLKYEDFDPEEGQIDGTLAHAIERSLFFICEQQGYQFKKIVSKAAPEAYLENAIFLEAKDVPLHLKAPITKLLANRSSSQNHFNHVSEVYPVEVLQSSRSEARLNLILPTLKPSKVYGGISTAIASYKSLAEAMGVELRVLVVSDDVDSGSVEEISRRLGTSVTLSSPRGDSTGGATVVDVTSNRREPISIRKSDFFFATAWWTADLAFRLKDAQQAMFLTSKPVVYLIQDYEPGFYSWSEHYALAEATYHRGDETLAIINSEELLGFMMQRYSFRQAWFVPYSLNARLDELISPTPKEKIILCYGRPSTPRNCFHILAEGLRRWQRSSPAEAAEYEIVFAGEYFDPARISFLKNARVAGKMSLDDYADILNRSAIGVSLMISPHPSYPPLEMANAGCLTITNGYEGKDMTRRSNQLLSIQALSPQSLSEAIAEAVSNTEAGSNPPLRTVKDLKGKGQPIDFEELAEVLGRVSHERSKS